MAMKSAALSDRHMLVLWWLSGHPGHTPERIANGLRAPDGADEIAELCRDLAAAGMVDLPWQRN